MAESEEFVRVTELRNSQEYQDLQNVIESVDELKTDLAELKERIDKYDTQYESDPTTLQMTRKLVELQVVLVSFVIPYFFATNMTDSTRPYTFSSFIWEFTTVIVWTVWIVEFTKTMLDIYRLYNTSASEDTPKPRRSVTKFALELGSWRLRSKWTSNAELFDSLNSSSNFESDNADEDDDFDNTGDAEVLQEADEANEDLREDSAVEASPREDFIDLKGVETI